MKYLCLNHWLIIKKKCQTNLYCRLEKIYGIVVPVIFELENHVEKDHNLGIQQ